MFRNDQNGKNAEHFKQPKNRQDNLDFGDLRTKSIAATQGIFFLSFRANEQRNKRTNDRTRIEEFENGLAEYFGADHAFCCSSGTAALHLAYAGMGADQQSIAIVPAVTFSATANAFKYLGSEILFCDIIPDTGILCLNHLEELLSTINPSEFSKVFIVAGFLRRNYSATNSIKGDF
mgnify:CR=1 FL=1